MALAKSENIEQTLLVDLIRSNHPNVLVYAIPNGGYRDAREASNLKRTGVLAGIPDLCIPEPRKPFHGLYIELKRNDRIKARVSAAQNSIIEQLRARGYRVEVAWGAKHAYEIFCDYINA